MKRHGQVYFVLMLLTAIARAEFAAPTSGGMVELKTEGPTITPAEPPKPSDRAQKSKAAAAAAAGMAAMQNVNCMRMMDEARKEEDKSNKQIMMMMASQQCAQAAETAKSADKNEESSKALSQADIPKQATMTAGKLQLVDSTAKEATLPIDAANANSRSEEKKEENKDIIVVDTFQPTLNPNGNARGAQTASDAPAEPYRGVPVEPKSALSPIDRGKVEFNESQKNASLDSGPATGIGIAGAMPFAQARTLSDSTKSESAASRGVASVEEEEEEEGIGSGERKIRALGGEEEGGSGGGGGEGASSGSGGGGNEAFDAMLAQLMGGGGAGEFEPLSGQDVVVLPEGEADRPGPNLFEYATYRYQKATYDEGRIRNRPPQNTRPLTTPAVARATNR